MRVVASRFVPLVPLRGLIAFPHEVYPIFIGRRKSLRAIDAATDPKLPLAINKPILLVAQRDASLAAPSPADMYEIGTLGVVIECSRLPDGTAKIIVEGRKRLRVKRFVFDEKFFKAEAEEIAETAGSSARLETLKRSVLFAFHSYAYGIAGISPEIVDLVEKIGDPSVLSYKIVRHLDIETAEQQALLECVSPVERLEKILGYLEVANQTLEAREGTLRKLI